jgi:tetratricopeptide (TPR) repeat protein
MHRSIRSLAGGLIVMAVLATAAVAADDRDICAKESGDVAIAACDRVIASATASPQDRGTAHTNRGQEYYIKKDYTRAIADFTKAIEYDPQDQLAYGNRANARSVLRQTDAAIDDYTQAIRIDPKYPAAYTGRGLEREKKGDVAGALADYRAALAVPAKYDDGKWAHDRARQRIAALTQTK